MNRGVIVGVVVTIVVVAIVIVSLTTREDAQENGATSAVDEHGSQASGDGERGPADHAKSSKGRRRKGVRVKLPKGLAEKFVGKGYYNPPRPFRFYCYYGAKGQGRTKADARARAEDVRRRFLDGEEAFTLIRELSDRPRYIPPELTKRWVNLAPDDASPVIPIEDGFAVFFGTPPNPRGASSPDAGSEGDGGTQPASE